MHAGDRNHGQRAVMKQHNHLLQVGGGVGAIQRDTHAKQIAFELFQIRKAPAATMPPQHHEDVRQLRQRGKQAIHGAPYAGGATPVG